MRDFASANGSPEDGRAFAFRRRVYSSFTARLQLVYASFTHRNPDGARCTMDFDGKTPMDAVSEGRSEWDNDNKA